MATENEDLLELAHLRRVLPHIMSGLHYHAHIGPNDPKDWRECSWCKGLLTPPNHNLPDPRVALKEWLDNKGHGARAELARVLGVDGSTITYLLQGRFGPSDEVARAIEAETGVPALSWPLHGVNPRKAGA